MSSIDPEPAAPIARVGVGYAALQWSRALLACDGASDAQALQRAEERVRRWQRVVGHALQGTASYGSRTPFADIPAWATLEVVTGGFATGALMAGGELSEHERALAATIPGIRDNSIRMDLNAWHLTDAGIAAMAQRVALGDFRIEVPEEAALPVAVWLLGQRRPEEARTLIETLAPWFDRLRFFPPPAQGLPVSATLVHVCSAGEVRQRLAEQAAQPRLATQKLVIEQRLPLFDEAVALFLTTYSQDWPCRLYPEGWQARAATLCARYADQRAELRLADASRDRVAELYSLLEMCAREPRSLSGRQVGRVRRIVGDFVRKHGAPESDGHRAFRLAQRREVAGPGHHRIAQVVANRLAVWPAESGVAEVEALTAAIDVKEAETLGLSAGTALPREIRRRLERCRSGSITELVDHGLITSSDTIANLLPAMTAQVRSAGFADPALATLYAQTYRAFRRRRSLLLLDLQCQVAIGELPWIAAIMAERQSNAIAVPAARQVLTEVAELTLTAFPHAILPNKLLREFRALAQTAALDLPFVEEVAADIFMGRFSVKFQLAARRAASLLAGTLYARYYDIDTAALAALPDTAKPNGPPVVDALAALSAQRARAQLGTWLPAINGMILEQQQILTTHNLALLFGDLDLRTRLHSRIGALAKDCFIWLCGRLKLRLPADDRHARLSLRKNAAYAWRQMLFYLSMLGEAGLRSALDDIETQFAQQPADFQLRFLPAMRGLRLAASGQCLPQHGPTADGARVFLGWTADRHWLADG